MRRGSHRRSIGRKYKQSSSRPGRNSSTSLRGIPANAVIRVSFDSGWSAVRKPESQDKLWSEFKNQADQWRRDTLHTSSLTKMVMHPSYLRIIGMGRSVLPLLFKELQERPDHWLVALNAITGQDPAPSDGTFDEAVAAWLDWGRTHGYLG